MSAISRVCLVGCGKTKLSHPAMAKDLYTGHLFRLARAWAERNCGAWAILSARHGVVAPAQVLAPYDGTIANRRITDGTQLPIQDYRRWISASAQAWLCHFPGAEVVVLAGEQYCALLEEGYLRLTLTKPLQGLQVGERLAWLKRELGEGA